jgi:hypothetical protein
VHSVFPVNLLTFLGALQVRGYRLPTAKLLSNGALLLFFGAMIRVGLQLPTAELFFMSAAPLIFVSVSQAGCHRVVRNCRPNSGLLRIYGTDHSSAGLISYGAMRDPGFTLKVRDYL